MKIIATEEHFSIKELYLDKSIKRVIDSPEVQARFDRMDAAILDLDETRIGIMDEAGIDMHVLLLSEAGVQNLDKDNAVKMSEVVNDTVAAAAKRYPNRFIPFGAVAPQDPKHAAGEVKRAVTGLGLKGFLINSHTNGEYLDNKKYWPMFEAMEKHEAPLYIHPRAPLCPDYSAYNGLAGALLGFSHDVSLHIMRLIGAGLFDDFPKLQVIIGHLGEALPYWLWRMDNHWVRKPIHKQRKRLPSEYLKSNIYITTSGMFSEPPLVCAISSMGADRILFAVDYPYESSRDGADFIRQAGISEKDREKICHANVENLLKICPGTVEGCKKVM